MNHTHKIILFLLIFCAFALGGWAYYSNSVTKAESKANALTEIQKGDIESLVTSQGTLEPKDYVDIGAQVSGMIDELHVEIGDNVKKGDLIAEIDPDIFEATVLANKAQLANLLAQREEKEVNVRQAQQKFDRNRRLYKSKAVSHETLQDSENTLDISKASLHATEAQIEQAQSTLDLAQTNLEFTKIYSAMDGTVVSEEVAEGQIINASQTTPTIVQVANLDIMTVVAEVAEADVMKLSEGMDVYFSTLGSGDRKWNGVVRQIEPTPVVENDVVLYNVLVDVENKDGTLMSGMTTQMFFVLASVKDVPLIPVSALTKRAEDHDTDAGEAYRVIVEEDNGPKPRIIIVGARDRVHAEVVNGLAIGDKIITTSPPNKKAGAKKASNKSNQRGPGGPPRMGL